MLGLYPPVPGNRYIINGWGASLDTQHQQQSQHYSSVVFGSTVSSFANYPLVILHNPQNKCILAGLCDWVS